MPKLSAAARSQKPNKPLMVIADRTISYGEQWGRCRTLNRWLQELSLQNDTPILLAVTDEFERASLLLALITIGKPPLILDPNATPSEAAVILDGSDFGAVIAEGELNQHWELNDYNLPRLGVKTHAPKGIFGRLLNKRETQADNHTWPACTSSNPTPLEADVDPHSLAYIVFTSGTTSTPKGVEISRAALVAQMSVLTSQYALDDNCRLLNTLPLHHVDGLLQGPMLAWTSGGTLFRPMPFSTQHSQQYMDSIYRNRITHFIAVPTILALMHRLGHDWHEIFTHESFRFIVSCAGHLEHKLWETLEAAFGVPIVNMFGLSETGTSALFSGPDNTSRMVGSLGLPINSRIRIIDDEGHDVVVGIPGELLIAGTQLMRGYHRDTEATEEILRDGWLHTGDLGQQLATGHIEYVGRKKNQIISGGRNISPEEVSNCLNRHPNVIETIVFGQHDPDWGEQVVALAVVEQIDFDEADLTRWCRTHLSEYKIPKHILFVNHLEKGPSGKIRIDTARRLFVEKQTQLYKERQTGRGIEESVLTIAAKVFRLHSSELNINSDISNTTGWDSLAHMALILEIESVFSIRLSAREIMQVDSLAQLASICSGKIPA